MSIQGQSLKSITSRSKSEFLKSKLSSSR